jgi:transcriptional regulator with XRE-family HTH domain
MSAEYFGAVVKQVRKARKLTQRDLATVFCVGIHMVQNIEQGKDPGTMKSALDYVERLKALTLSDRELADLEHLAKTCPQRERYRRKEPQDQSVLEVAVPHETTDEEIAPLALAVEELASAITTPGKGYEAATPHLADRNATSALVEVPSMIGSTDIAPEARRRSKNFWRVVAGTIVVLLFIPGVWLWRSFNTAPIHVEEEAGKFLSITVNGEDKVLLPIDGEQHQHERRLQDAIQPGDAVEVRFIVRNLSDRLVIVCSIGAAVRGPDADQREWAADNYDMPSSGITTLWPGERYEYKQSRRFFEPGVYFIETVHSSCDHGSGGLRPSPRIWFTVEP